MLNALQTDLYVAEQVSAANDNSRWQRRFEVFHRENPHVYELFKKFTYQAIDAGLKHYAAAAIFHRIRWYSEIETKGDPFKIGQNFCPYYGRLFMRDHPEHAGFFRTRKLRS